MYMVIADITKDMLTVNEAVRQIGVGSASIESANALVGFYKCHRDTDSFIRDCVSMLRKGVDISSETRALRATLDDFFDLCGQFDVQLGVVDFKAMCENHLAPFENAYNFEKQHATELWRELQSISNRLDYMDERSQEYNRFRAECDELERAYTKSHLGVERLYAELREQETEYAALYYFDFSYLYSLVSVYANIADSYIFRSIGGQF